MVTANLCCTLFLCWLFDTGLFHSRVEHWQIPLRPTPDCQFNFKLVCRFCCLYLLYLPKLTARTKSFLSLQVSWDNLYVQKKCYYTRTDRPHHTWLMFQAQFVGNINTGCWPKLTSRTNSFLSLLVSWDNLYKQKRCYYTRTDWPLHSYMARVSSTVCREYQHRLLTSLIPQQVSFFCYAALWIWSMFYWLGLLFTPTLPAG